MHDLNLKTIDPRAVARAADYIGSVTGQGGPAADTVRATAAAVGADTFPGGGLFRPMPMMMPMAAPGPGGGYNRYREMTLEELLLENRVVFLVGEIHHASATRVIMQMLYLQSMKREADINFYINSPGGVVDDTLAMYDIMKFLSCDIATYCIGRAESGGAVVFMAGKKGKRYILPSAKVMIHQPLGGITGQAADIEIQAEEILKTKDQLIGIMAACTGQTFDRVREDSERDRFFDAKAAVAYGICDEVLGEDSPAAATAVDGNKTK
ncbi:MAG TPA: ATP-dependent Clp protease proteolytic subunit [Tepidisphaeraceae bacterium]|nr:ATP-dependent Clp protease proteolytic subunit [Tepidisphaeraceae bacterium]